MEKPDKEKRFRIYIVAENPEEENIFKAFKKLCIDQNLNQKGLLMKIIKEKIEPVKQI